MDEFEKKLIGYVTLRMSDYIQILSDQDRYIPILLENVKRFTLSQSGRKFNIIYLKPALGWAYNFEPSTCTVPIREKFIFTREFKYFVDKLDDKHKLNLAISFYPIFAAIESPSEEMCLKYMTHHPSKIGMLPMSMINKNIGEASFRIDITSVRYLPFDLITQDMLVEIYHKYPSFFGYLSKLVNSKLPLEYKLKLIDRNKNNIKYFSAKDKDVREYFKLKYR